ncbi:MAG: SDR family NAD(P)-dependent oxidoreductase [Flavobacterium sp.]|nr:SDR family NAD(P)-dependent oxidoreductase [Flavobacterium sp.]
MSNKAWLKVIETNLTGVFNIMHEESIHMAKQHNGVIVNIASIFDKTGAVSLSKYGVAKDRVIDFTLTSAFKYATSRHPN